MTIKIEKTIELPKADIEFWELLLASDDIDYAEMQFPEESAVFTKTIRFDDGFEADLKVCTNRREDRDCWSEMVLFDSKGNQIDHTDVSYDLAGQWELGWFDRANDTMHLYEVNVEGV